MKTHRALIASPLKWQRKAVPVPHPAIPVLAEHGGTQLKTPRPVILVDTREQNPFDFSRFEAGLLESKNGRSSWEITPSRVLRITVWSSPKILPIWSIPSRLSGPCLSIDFGARTDIRIGCS